MKDVGYLRRILNEVYAMKAEVIYINVFSQCQQIWLTEFCFNFVVSHSNRFMKSLAVWNTSNIDHAPAPI